MIRTYVDVIKLPQKLRAWVHAILIPEFRSPEKGHHLQLVGGGLKVVVNFSDKDPSSDKMAFDIFISHLTEKVSEQGKPTTFVGASKFIKREAKRAIDRARGQDSGYYIYRELEIGALDSDGSRYDEIEPISMALAKVSGNSIQEAIGKLLKWGGVGGPVKGFFINGGIDRYESLHEATINPYDYDPLVEQFDLTSKTLMGLDHG